MNEKTMGQVAFEAYREAVGGVAYDGKPIPGWWELSGDTKTVQDGWEAAALAVIHQHMMDALPTDTRRVRDFREGRATRWAPVGNPVPPAEVESLPPGVAFAQLPPVADEERTSVPVESGPDED